MPIKYLPWGLLALLTASVVYAEPLTYQGQLKVNDTPASGTYDFRFRLWDADSGGAQVRSDQFVNDLTVQNGLFTAELDFGSVWDGSDRYLEIAVRPGASAGAYTDLRPRVKITRTPYAAHSDAAPPVGAAGGDLSGTYPDPTVAKLQGRLVSSSAPATDQVLKWDGSMWSPAEDLGDEFWQTSGSNIFYNTGNVGIGTNDPLSPLQVQTARGDRAIYGMHTAGNTINYAVYGVSNSTAGTGVLGIATADSGTTYGVQGTSDSSDGTGMLGWASATSGFTYGGSFRSDSTSGRGVLGHATARFGTTFGVYGRNDSTAGRGVYGVATAKNGITYGVIGQSDSLKGYGIYSIGRFAATGVKSFQMDHPLSPETHYLHHFCTEGPEPYNTYSGNVVTDAQGYAVVELPDYFESINRDFRYQLTVIDGGVASSCRQGWCARFRTTSS